MFGPEPNLVSRKLRRNLDLDLFQQIGARKGGNRAGWHRAGLFYHFSSSINSKNNEYGPELLRSFVAGGLTRQFFTVSNFNIIVRRLIRLCSLKDFYPVKDASFFRIVKTNSVVNFSITWGMAVTLKVGSSNPSIYIQWTHFCKLYFRKDWKRGLSSAI